MVISRDTNGDEGQVVIDKRCNSLRQSIELMYGNFFRLFNLFKSGRFRLFRGSEIAYRTCLMGF